MEKRDSYISQTGLEYPDQIKQVETIVNPTTGILQTVPNDIIIAEPNLAIKEVLEDQKVTEGDLQVLEKEIELQEGAAEILNDEPEPEIEPEIKKGLFEKLIDFIYVTIYKN